jgi:hypothetical protein
MPLRPGHNRSGRRSEEENVRTVSRLIVTATLIAVGLTAVTPTVLSVAPTIEAPTRVYTPVNTPLAFTAADPVSLESRSVELADPATSSAPCDPSAASPNYDGCITAKFDLFPNQNAVSDYGTIAVTLAGQADINTGTNGSTTFQVIGSLADVNATIATLVYTPPPDEGGVPFETRNPLELVVTSINGDGTSDQATHTIEIKVEGDLDPPVLTVPAGPITVTLPDDEFIYPDDGPGPGVDPITVEDPDVEQGELDDVMLIVLYLDCGGAPGGGIMLSGGGGINGADLADAVASEATSLPVGTITAVLAAMATVGVPVDVTTLSFDNGGPGVNVVAEISDLDGINDVVERIFFYPPASNATCELWYIVTDFGNNGMPALYNPAGFEVPSLDPTEFIAVDSTVFEVEGNGAPDAVATHTRRTSTPHSTLSLPGCWRTTATLTTTRSPSRPTPTQRTERSPASTPTDRSPTRPTRATSVPTPSPTRSKTPPASPTPPR